MGAIMKRKHVLGLVGLVLGLLLGWHFLGSARTPDGQSPLAYLSPNSPEEFNADFDRSAENARLVLLLSPT
jgi:hypothetical protein